MKYLIWLVIALAVIVWIQRAKKSLTAAGGQAGADAGARGQRGKGGAASRQRVEQPETMVQCAHCGIHFPASESVTNLSGAVYCSDEHRRLASV